jgi:multiple sugar transport system permease protein
MGRPTPRTGLVYIAPAAAFALLWIYGPLGFTVVLSFLHWNLTTGHSKMAGLANYRTLFDGGDFGHALGRTLLYIVGLLPFATVVPFGLAVLLWKHGERTSTSIYRALLFAPVVFAPVAGAIAWQFLLNPLLGDVNHVLGLAHLPQPNWLGAPDLALWTITFITGTKVAALNFLFYMAGLAGIDGRMIEAARIDGASEREVTVRLLVPMMSKTFALTVLLAVVLGGQWTFTNVNVLTQGGPAGATDNVFYWLYEYGFQYFDAGLASAGAVLVTLALSVAVFAPRAMTHLLRRS